MSLFLIIETGLLVVAASVRIDHVKGKTSASFIVRYIAEVPTNICACQEANEPKAHCLTVFHYKINFTCTVSLFLKFGLEDRYLSLLFFLPPSSTTIVLLQLLCPLFPTQVPIPRIPIRLHALHRKVHKMTCKEKIILWSHGECISHENCRGAE